MLGARRGGGRRGGYSLLEVMVALAIFIVGVVGIMQLFPPSLKATADASMRGKASMLAQQKAEEIRRDVEQGGAMMDAIRDLADPTPLIIFPEEWRLGYQFHSRSLLSPDFDDPTRDDDDFDVPRVIVRYNPEYRPAATILVELRFDR